MNKHGSARDVVLIAVLLFIGGLVFFIANFASHTMVDGMLNIAVINDSNATREALNSFETQSDRFDYLGVGLFIGLTLAIIIGGWLVGGHPVFMFIYFIVVLVGVALSAVLANTWESVTLMPIFGSTITNFIFMNHIISYLPIYVSIVGILGLIVMFSRLYVSGGDDGHL